MSICLLCGFEINITKPNEVCDECYEKVKKSHFHSREYWQEKEECDANIFRIMNKGKDVSEKVKAGNIESSMRDEETQWKQYTKDGLRVLDVIIYDILDEIDFDTDDEMKKWHKKRLDCVIEIIKSIDKKIFLPATEKDMDNYIAYALDYWNDRSDESERRKRKVQMKNCLKKDHVWEHDAKTLLHSLLDDEDNLDFFFYQYFEFVKSCVKYVLDDKTFVRLLFKLFQSEVRSWVIGA